MKAILMSIKPKWVAKILNGEKTIEIRKRFPSDYRGWVYIYCTKDKNNGLYWTNEWLIIPQIEALPSIRNGKVVARFWCDDVEDYANGCLWRNKECNYSDYEKILEPSCLTEDELYTYTEDLHFYAIHISKLEIFDKPKELSEFMPIKWNKCGVKDKNGLYQCDKCPFGGNWWEHGGECRYGPLTKAPQSWQYIEI